MSFFLGIDLGTSYFKAGIFDEKGCLRGLGRKYVHKVSNGKTCELPVDVFWKTLRECVDEAMQKADIQHKNVRSMSYSSQTNSFILLDFAGKPLTPFILWPDKRAAGMKLPAPDDFIEKTGLGIVPNHELTVAKISWLQKMQPAIWENTAHILSISDYLVFKLTGEKICDYSTASMTGLFDQKEKKWWTQQLDYFHIGSEQLPAPERSGTAAGTLTAGGAQLLGLSANTLFCLGALDHHCAAVGGGIVGNDDVVESTGTVLSCVGSSSEYNPGKNFCTSPGLFDGQYFRMAFDNNGALSLEWYQKNFAGGYSIVDLLNLAEETGKDNLGLSAKPCANSYSGLEGFINVRPVHRHGHFVRALLESTSQSLASLIGLIKGGDFSGRVISTGGGAQSDLWIKIKAGMLGVSFCVPECSETACQGAAMIGATGSGESGRWDEWGRRWVRFKKIIRPV